MLKREYDITYKLNGDEKQVAIIADGKNYQIKINDTSLNITIAELEELSTYLHSHGLDAQMQDDILAIIKQNDDHQLREDINYYLVDLESSLLKADKKFVQKFIEFKNRFANAEKDLEKDLLEFDEFEKEFDDK